MLFCEKIVLVGEWSKNLIYNKMYFWALSPVITRNNNKMHTLSTERTECCADKYSDLPHLQCACQRHAKASTHSPRLLTTRRWIARCRSLLPIISDTSMAPCWSMPQTNTTNLFQMAEKCFYRWLVPWVQRKLVRHYGVQACCHCNFVIYYYCNLTSCFRREISSPDDPRRQRERS